MDLVMPAITEGALRTTLRQLDETITSLRRMPDAPWSEVAMLEQVRQNLIWKLTHQEH